MVRPGNSFLPRSSPSLRPSGKEAAQGRRRCRSPQGSSRAAKLVKIVKTVGVDGLSPDEDAAILGGKCDERIAIGTHHFKQAPGLSTAMKGLCSAYAREKVRSIFSIRKSCWTLSSKNSTRSSFRSSTSRRSWCFQRPQRDLELHADYGIAD